MNATKALLNFRGQWKIDNNSWFNLITIFQHELGHTLGFLHIANEASLPCKNKWGIMNNGGPYDKTQRSRLTKDDKCYFKKMYCPNGSIVGVDGGNSIAFSLPAYPNLARDIVNIPFKLNKQGGVKIVVYKENGEKIYTVLDVDNFPFGEHSIYYNNLLTSSGNYFYSVKTVEGVTISKFVIQR